MTATLVGDEVDILVAPLRAAVDQLLDSRLDALAAADVTALVSAVEVQKRRLAAVDHRLIAQITERSLAGQTGSASPTALLVSLLRVAPGEAKARIRAAEQLNPQRTVTGEMLAPVLPATAAAAREGQISTAHVSVISKALNMLPTTLPDGVFQIAEQFLVDTANHEHPSALLRTADQLLRRLDPDGTEPREDERERRRGFDLKVLGDGSSDGKCRFTPELTEILLTVFDSLAAPQPGVDADGDAVPDLRSATQRRHDALAEALGRVMRTGNLPTPGGVPVSIVLTTDYRRATPDGVPGQLNDPNAEVRTSHGSIWSVRQMLQLAGDAQIRLLALGDTGEPLWLGRKERCATPAQRTALAVRDRGCCFPGCDRPPAWTEAHHVNEWLRDDGPTDIDNLCLLCRYHHRHFAGQGWAVRIADDGHPEWRPPAHLDPQQRPVRNHAHHHRDPAFLGVDRR